MIKNRHFAAVVNNKASLIQFIVLMMIKQNNCSVCCRHFHRQLGCMTRVTCITRHRRLTRCHH